MDEFVNFWPIVSGVIVVAALAVAFRAEITVRVRVLEEKVSALFQIVNDREK
jgi:transglutaminase-like putative cysteine protease